MDRRRAPLDGDEIRSCWQAAGPAAKPAMPGATGAFPLGFVEIDPTVAPGSDPGEPRWNLWGDPDS